jgi:hypothetical protein
VDVARTGRYARFLVSAVAVVVIAVAIGVLPTRRLGGEAAIPAMAAGCLISFVSAALAGWLLVMFDAATPTARMQRAFLAMAVRLAVVIVLGLAAALSGEVARSPLLLWLAITYLALLPLEVKLAIE